MERPGRLEPFVRLIAEPSKGLDMTRLDMLLQSRARLYVDDPPDKMNWTWRDNGTI